MTTTVKVEDAAEMLADLLARVERGEEVVLERDGVPVARMTGCESHAVRGSRRLGGLVGTAWMSDDFNELPMDETAIWEAPGLESQ